MAIDLNTIPVEEAEHHLPDLNGELLDEQADEVHVAFHDLIFGQKLKFLKAGHSACVDHLTTIKKTL